jgi:hypothetical protein
VLERKFRKERIAGYKYTFSSHHDRAAGSSVTIWILELRVEKIKLVKASAEYRRLIYFLKRNDVRTVRENRLGNFRKIIPDFFPANAWWQNRAFAIAPVHYV